MRIAMIGAGNAASSLAPALARAGDDVVQVYSRTMRSAARLAAALGCGATDDLGRVVADADVYIVALKDGAVAGVLPRLCKGREDKVFLHTAGSLPMGVFEGLAVHYGVLYPMQTFTRERPLDFGGIPCFVEGSDDAALGTAEALARGISGRVYRLGSEERRHLHLAAVFACNFANRCYGMAAEILERRGIPFDVMLPLIDETARKVHYMSPREAQTGPAVRYDAGVIGAQSALLAGRPDLRRIYDAMSESIHNAAAKADEQTSDEQTSDEQTSSQ